LSTWLFNLNIMSGYNYNLYSNLVRVLVVSMQPRRGKEGGQKPRHPPQALYRSHLHLTLTSAPCRIVLSLVKRGHDRAGESSQLGPRLHCDQCLQDPRAAFFNKANPGSGSFHIGFALLLKAVCCRAVRTSESGGPVVVGFPQPSMLMLAC